MFGVNADDLKSHGKFATKHNLTYPLLSDPERILIEALGLWVEKQFMGKKYMGINRSTFLVDANGNLEHVWENVKPDGHALAIIAHLNSQ